MPAVPAPSGRSAALTADSTPSIASALESMPPSLNDASTIADQDRQHQHEHERRVARVAERVGGGLRRTAASRTSPARRRSRCTSSAAVRGPTRTADAVDALGDSRLRRRRRSEARARRRQPCAATSASSAAATCSTVSHARGASTLATCGANTGDAASASRDRRVGDDLALGHHDDPCARVRRRTRRRGSRRRPRARRPRVREDRRAAAPWRRSRVRGSARRAAAPRARRQLDGERERQPLAVGEVARVRVGAATATPISRSKSARAVPGVAPPHRRRRRTPRRPSRGRAGRSPAAEPARSRGRRLGRATSSPGRAADHGHRPPAAAPDALQAPTAATTCPSRCDPSARRPRLAPTSKSTLADRHLVAVLNDDRPAHDDRRGRDRPERDRADRRRQAAKTFTQRPGQRAARRAPTAAADPSRASRPSSTTGGASGDVAQQSAPAGPIAPVRRRRRRADRHTRPPAQADARPQAR